MPLKYWKRLQRNSASRAHPTAVQIVACCSSAPPLPSRPTPQLSLQEQLQPLALLLGIQQPVAIVLLLLFWAKACGWLFHSRR